MSEITYRVLAGTGLKVIATGLSKEDAEKALRRFELRCARAGVAIPRGRIEAESKAQDD